MEASSTKEDEPCAYAKLWGQLDGKPFHTYVTALPSTLGRGSTATEGDKKPPGFIDLGRSKALSREHAEISWVPAQRVYQITCMSKNGMVVAGSYHAKGGKEKLESRAPIKLGPASMYFLLPETEAPAPAPAPAPARGLVLLHDKSKAQPPLQASSQPQPPAENGTTPAVASPTPTQPPKPAVANPPAAAAAAAAAPAGASPMADLFTFADMVSGAFRSQELSAAAAAGGLSSGDLQNWIMQAHPEWGQEGARMKALAVGIEDALNKNFVSIGEDRWTVPPREGSAKRAKFSSPNNGTSVVAAAAAAADAATKAGAPPAAAPAGIAPTPAPTPAAGAAKSPEATDGGSWRAGGQATGESSSPAVSAATAAAAGAGTGFAAGGNGAGVGGVYG